ncbi:fatty acid desaturase [Nocardioides stalactiti]|uniref:fatty acid desaturase n=1 Tax=Nocardioides stalactiti TaxID=2755356 RepID=UPI0016015230|nr:fatty acid desaturase [Nocardioides stalactiti]
MTTQSDTKSETQDASTRDWNDKKRYLWLLGLVVPSIAFLAFAGYTLLGWSAALWLGPILVFVIIPILDVMIGLDSENPPDDLIEALENDKYYRWITYAYLPIQYAGLVAAMAMIAGVNPLTWTADLVGATGWIADTLSPQLVADLSLSVADKIGLALSVGCIAGIGINTAHELGHKREANERWLSKVALAQSFYGHFYIEHNRGHHVRVATPEDPASSRLGETFYQFWPRTVAGSLKSAWELEAKRYARKDTHPFHLGNDVLNAWLMSVVLFGGLIAVFGLEVAPYLLLQAVVGFSLLEVVNFLEHYGMLRQKVGPEGKQRYERVSPSHSWNSNNIVTNVFLYHLQRHSDHHANPTRRYQTLRAFDESPTLPMGYAGCIVMALFPPVWRAVMDDKVVAHLGGDVTLANIQPSKREKYYAKYGAVEHAPAIAEDISAQDVQGEVLAARCPGCSYVYEVAAGAEHEGFAAGTAWNEIPDDWCCPDCGVREKVDFVPVDPETLAVAAR